MRTSSKKTGSKKKSARGNTRTDLTKASAGLKNQNTDSKKIRCQNKTKRNITGVKNKQTKNNSRTDTKKNTSTNKKIRNKPETVTKKDSSKQQSRKKHNNNISGQNTGVKTASGNTKETPDVVFPVAKKTKKTNMRKIKIKIQSWNRMSKYSSKTLMESNKDLHRWYDNLRRSSILNAKVRLRRVNLFCDRVQLTPAQLVSIGEKDPKKIEDCIMDHITWMENEKYSPGYIEGVVKSVKSWLDYNRVEIKRKMHITDARVAVTLQDEQVPEQAQLRKILAAGSIRGRVIISLMGFSGVRPQVIGLSDASDGLRIGDIPDIVVEGKKVRFSKTPAMIVVRRNLSKTRNKYITFLTDEGCGHLLEYLKSRIACGDILGSDSPVIATEHKGRNKGWRKKNPQDQPFLVTPAITGSIRKAIWSVIKMRPYALRAYFDTQLLLAESHGCMTHAYRQFFMGHTGDMEARYTTNKGRLTEQMEDDMRRSFTQSQIFLSTDSKSITTNKKEMLLDMWRRQASMYGIDPAKLILNQHPPDTEHAPKTLDNQFESHIVEDEKLLLAYISNGWDVIRELGSDKFLMRRAKDYMMRGGGSS